MAKYPIEGEHLRPAFYQAIAKWTDVSVTAAHPNVVTIRRESATAQAEHTALLVVGKNRLDSRLFERCAAHNMHRFLEAGWSIELVDFDFTPKLSISEATQVPPPGAIVAQALAETQRLRYVVLLTHSRYAINLSESGNDLVVERPSNGSLSDPGVPIRQLRLSESAAEEGWVDVFGCLCRHDALWPQELAKTLNWPVRTVYPGYGIYFPEENHDPRSAIPFTRGLSRGRYAKRGWAVWLPGSDRPVRVSEPGETARRYDNRYYDPLERFLTRVVSVGLEPVRDFRKRRLFAAHAARSGGKPCSANHHQLLPGPRAPASIGERGMTNAAIGTIATAGVGPVGSSVRVVGAVIAVRQLGKVSFIVIRDAFSEIQVVVSGELQTLLKNEPPPFYATVSGVLRRRPAGDVRSDSVNGSVEIEADALHIHRHGGRSLGHPLDGLLQLTTFLQSRGFLDVNTLAKAFAPSYSDLMSSVEELGPAKHLTYLLGPCRWYLLTNEYLFFGLTPGFIADLKGWLDVGGQPAGATARETLDRASWHEEYADASVAHAPIAYGAIAIRSDRDNVGRIEGSGYWRSRHSIAHLSDGLVATAAERPKLDDAAVRTLEEGLSRGEALLQAISGSAGRRSTAIILRDLTEFDLQARHMEEMLALFPSLEKRLAHSDGEQQFEILWSILGHDHVKAVFSSPEAVGLLSACIRAGMFSDYNVLRCLDPGTLKSICTLTRNFTRRESVELIDKMFSSVPSVSASACYLMEELDRSGLDWGRCAAVAKCGVVSRVAFAAAALDLAPAEDMTSWRSDLASRLKHLFANDPVDETSCWSALTALTERFDWLERVVEECRDADLIFDLVHLTFGNGLVAYGEAARMYSEASDCSQHWAAAGIDFGGERWNRAERRFDLTHFWLYPSKNRPAILAKSCSGICSARNVHLFNRRDHFQFTLVEPAGHFAAGTVQMYSHRDEEGREIWVVRGLNPSEKVAVEPVGFTIEVLDTLASLARHSGVSALVCADGAGLFNADSSRVSIRAVLRRSAATAKRISFNEPLHVFDYHDRPVSIEFGWQVWP